MFLFNFLFALLPFQNEPIPSGLTIWDYRASQEIISLRVLEPGERVFFIASLPDSYEHQILQEVGYTGKIRSIPEWKEIFRAQGYTVSHAEVRHEIASFQSLNAVAEWIAPSLSPKQTDAFISVLQKRGWVELGDQKINLPYKRVVFVLE